MRIITLLGISLVTLLTVGCQSVAIKDDLAKIEPGNAVMIAEDWSALIASQFNVTTVFVLRGQGAIGQALSEALRANGYGVTTFVETDDQHGTTLEVRTDNIGKSGILVSLIIDENIISRSYQLNPKGTIPDSRFTQLTAKEEE